MSRIGKLPIKVPNDIKVNIEGEVIKITKGSVSKEYTFGDKVSVSFENDSIHVSIKEGLDKRDVNNFYG